MNTPNSPTLTKLLEHLNAEVVESITDKRHFIDFPFNLEAFCAEMDAILADRDQLRKTLDIVSLVSMTSFEDSAREWQRIDPENRTAQYFWEGGLEMRRQIAVRARQALAKSDEVERE